MTKYQPGDDIVLDFDGLEHNAEVLNHRNGWVTAMMRPDPQADYGSGTSRIDPTYQTVCVPEKRVRKTDTQV
jgi:hypothetical protein